MGLLAGVFQNRLAQVAATRCLASLAVLPARLLAVAVLTERLEIRRVERVAALGSRLDVVDLEAAVVVVGVAVPVPERVPFRLPLLAVVVVLTPVEVLRLATVEVQGARRLRLWRQLRRPHRQSRASSGCDRRW